MDTIKSNNPFYRACFGYNPHFGESAKSALLKLSEDCGNKLRTKNESTT
jgi:hypothetical protein